MDKQQSQIKNNLNLFGKYINKNLKLIPFNVKPFDLGSIKYLPPVSKE
jgi:hypothetical protein